VVTCFNRCILSALPLGQDHITTVGLPNFLDPKLLEQNDNSIGLGSKKRTKGSDGEMDPNATTPPTTAIGASSPEVRLSQSPNAVSDDGSVDPLFTTQRVVDTIRRDDGSAEMHVSIRCTLGDLAKATNLRVEDAAFALHECGLVVEQLDEADYGDQLLISGALVEKIAAERRVKDPCINLSCVLL